MVTAPGTLVESFRVKITASETAVTMTARSIIGAATRTAMSRNRRLLFALVAQLLRCTVAFGSDEIFKSRELQSGSRTLDVDPPPGLRRDEQQVQPKSVEVDEGFKLLPRHIWGETRTFFTSPRTLPVLGIGVGLSLLAAHAPVGHQHNTIDQSFREHISDPADSNSRPRYLGLANLGAESISIVSGAIAIYGIGRARHSSHLMNTGLILVEGVALDQILVQSIKFSVPRSRPDGTRYSFPSGHVADTTMLAIVLQDRWGWKASAPAYAYAAFTAYSRMEAERHWLSDTLFGAALGVATGIAATRYHHRPAVVVPTDAVKPSTFAIVPLVYRGALGIGAVIRR